MATKDRPSDKNLIPFNERSEEERRESGRKGGVASGESRRFKKRLCELLDEHLTEEKRIAINAAIEKKAARGDVRAWLAIRDSLGEKPSENFRVNTGEKSEGLLELEAYIAERGYDNE